LKLKFVLAAAFALALFPVPAAVAQSGGGRPLDSTLAEVLKNALSEFCIPQENATCDKDNTPTFVESSTTPSKCQCSKDNMVYHIEERECKFCQRSEDCNRSGYFSSPNSDNCIKYVEPTGLGSVGRFATGCNPCPIGTYKRNLTTCTLCRNGTFAPQAGLERCEVCPSRTFTSDKIYELDANGLYKKEGLDAGYEYLTKDRKRPYKNECIAVADGYQVKVQSYCTDNTNSEMLIESTADLGKCKSGTIRHYNVEPSDTPCKFYVNENDFHADMTKPAGINFGSSDQPKTGSCKELGKGYIINTRRNGQVQCQAGEYAHVEVNTATNQIITNTCRLCDTGSDGAPYYSNTEVGIWNHDDTFEASDSGNPLDPKRKMLNGCVLVDDGYSIDVVDGRKTGQKVCEYGKYSNKGTQFICTMRTLGNILTGCAKNVGTASNPKYEGCKGQTPCDAGKEVNDDDITACSNCAKGTYAHAVSENCSSRTVGYKLTGCEERGTGTQKYHDTCEGQTKCSDGEYVDPGSNGSYNSCSKCAGRTYSNWSKTGKEPKDDSCHDADPGHIVNSNSTGQTDCGAGFYVDSTGNGGRGECKPRSTGHVINSDRLGQTKCSNGEYANTTAGNGKDGVCSKCLAGEYSDKSISTGWGSVRDDGCDVCLGDTYSSSSGATACTPCPAGKVIIFPGSQDSRQNHDSASDCITPTCPAGSSWDQGVDEQGNCPAGYWKKDIENECPAGFYRVTLTQ
jgi:hypothetical protein